MADGAHGTHILLAVFDHLLHELGVVTKGRHAHEPDKLRTTVVLLHAGAAEATDVFERTRRAVGTRLRGGADELFELEVDL